MSGLGTSRTLQKPVFDWMRTLLYVDRGAIVLNKPVGLVCQPGEGLPDNLDGVEGDFNGMLESLKENLGLKANPCSVHRLDKGTTGALVIGSSPRHAGVLSNQFKNHEVKKTYLALVRGGRASFPGQSGRISTTMKFPNGKPSLALSSSRNTKPAETDWELVASSESSKTPISLLRLGLLTGLKHQLRVHLAQVLRTPILGDTLYSDPETHSKEMASLKIPTDRIFLHASHISFKRYRREGALRRKMLRLGVTAPLPKDFLRLCGKLGIRVDDDVVRGGIYVGGKRIEDGQVPEVEGRWLGK